MVNKLVTFFERYQGIAVEFGTSESPTSRIEDGFDLAIHSGELLDSTLVACRFAQTLRILVATPQVLARHSLPRSSLVARYSVSPEWCCAGMGVQYRSADHTLRRFRAGDLEQLRVGVLEHLGIAQAPAWLFVPELREGTVVRLLTKYERTVPISCVRPASRRPPTRVRTLMEHLEASFAVCMQFHPTHSPQLEVDWQRQCICTDVSREIGENAVIVMSAAGSKREGEGGNVSCTPDLA
jgi:LysR family transcriptional regulator for bpeEF and oprC